MPEPTWLDEQEMRTWRSLLRLMQTVELALDRQLERDSRMSHASYAILAILSGAPEHTLRMGDLATALGWSQSRLSHAVARLERADWVRRLPCPTDKRSNLARLTEAGRRTLADAAPGHVTTARRLVFDGLTGAQLRTLTELCDTIADRATEVAGETG